MSIEATSWALGQTVGDPTRKLVLIAYANHAHKDGRHAWPSTATVAEYAECDPRTVIRHRKALVDDGWIREGDQQQVGHIRGDRRPTVYDLAMNDATQNTWKASQRGDTLSPRPDSTDCHPVTPSDGHGVTHGVTETAPRGDTWVSPEQKEPRNTPTSPDEPELPRLGTSTRVCQRHGTSPQPNCRGCGTTQRQIDAQSAADAAEQRRRDDQAATVADRARRAAATQPPAELIDQTRAAIRAGAR